jgi:Xaa-Pro aminopeptidase
MRQTGAEGCLLTVDVNLYYMTGRVFGGYYYLPAEGEPAFFVKRPNDCPLPHAIYIRKPEQMADFFTSHNKPLPKRLLLETDEISYNECIRLQTIFGQPDTVPATALMRRIRMLKTPCEVEQFRHSARQHAATYSAIPSLYRNGMTDLEFQAEIERQMRLNGSIGLFHAFGPNMHVFMGSVLAGANAEAPSPFDFALGGQGQTALSPFGANGTVLAQGMAIMVDMVGNYTPYMTDMTRVYAVGKLPEAARRAHEVSLEIQDEIVRIARPGVSCAALYDRAMALATHRGLANCFMGTRQQARFVGHGIGLQINEPPVLTSRSKDVLLPNMTFALEPKFVIPEVGAVGIENSFLVTETGVEKLTLFEEEIIEL